MAASEIIKELMHDLSEMKLPHGIPFGDEMQARQAAHYADVIDRIAALAAKAQTALVSDCIDRTGIGDMSEWKNHELLMVEQAQESFTTLMRQDAEDLAPYVDPNAEHRLSASQLGLTHIAAE